MAQSDSTTAPYTQADDEPWSGLVHFTDGTRLDFSTRERPHMIFADKARHTPVGVFTAVSDQPIAPACDTVRARPGRLSARSVLHSRSGLYGDCGRVHRAFKSQTRRFPARAVRAGRLLPVQDHARERLDLQPAPGEKGAELAQKLGQLQPFIAVLSQECMGRLASFGPT